MPIKPYKWDIIWRNVYIMSFVHFFGLIGLYHYLIHVKWTTFIFTYVLGFLFGQGITAGAHRLWAHRAYKANLPLRIFLAAMQTLALQTPIYEWVRDHRVHHKHTDTNSDPHNSTRGFFFSHMGWLLLRKQRDVIEMGKKLDMTDLENDPVVMWQRKYHYPIGAFVGLLLPALIPWYYFGEDLYVSWTVVCMWRYIWSLHATWAVNSVAHIWGSRPYDGSIRPAENVGVAIAAFGEGWHNYHHVFPWDYKAAELGNYRTNLSTAFIDLMAKIGWAYDRKVVNKEMVHKRARRTGDGTLCEQEEDDETRVVL